MAVLVATICWATPASADEVQWLVPVDAPLIDGFRPPERPYGPGNRGFEYGPAPGSELRAVDDGRVVFAGPVGGELFIVVDHGEGLRSTLGYVEEVDVIRGQIVTRGQVIGKAGPGLHLTARLDGVYIDPAALFTGIELAVALVDGDPPPRPVGANRGAIGHPRIERGWFDAIAATIDAAMELQPTPLLGDATEAVKAWFHRECSDLSDLARFGPDGTVLDLREPAPVPDRVLIQVGGLGTSSGASSIGRLDTDRLGYDRGSVIGFSYAGGCTPTPFGIEPGHLPEVRLGDHLPTSEYDPSDTYQDIDASARRLVELVESVATVRPGDLIDIAAHSLGGVVTRRAVELLAERGRSELLGVVATIGSPHAGADLATLAAAAHGGFDVLDEVAPGVAELRAAPAVIQLSEVGKNAIGPPEPVPDGVEVVSVGGAGDPVVTGTSAIWEGATNVVVATLDPRDAHAALPAATEVGDALLLARHGLPPACVPLAEVLAGVAGSGVVSTGENLITVFAGTFGFIL